MALSAAAHHSFDKVAAGEKYYGPRAQKTDRAGEAAHKAPRRQRSRTGSAAHLGARCRLRLLCAHGADSRRSCAQTVERLQDVLQFFDTLTTDPEQVIEVPKIFPEDVPMRAVLRDPQLVEQLAEVPTIVSYSWLQLRRSTTSTFQFLVVEGEFLVFKVFFPDRVQQHCMFLLSVFLSGLWSRSWICLVEAFKIFAQGRVHPLLCTFQLVFLKVWMSLVKGVFALFPKLKKCGVRILPESEGARQCQPIHASSSARCSSFAVGHDHVRSGALLLEQRHERDTLADGGWLQPWLVVAARWPLCRSSRQLTMVMWLWVLVRGGADCAWEPLVSYGGFWKNFLFNVAASSRCSHLEIWILPSPLLSLFW